MSSEKRVRRWVSGGRFWGLVTLIATAHWFAYVGAAGAMIASGESGTRGLGATSIEAIAWAIGLPLMYLLLLPPSTLGSTRWWGDDTNLIFGLAGLNALLWGVALASTWRWWLRRREAP